MNFLKKILSHKAEEIRKRREMCPEKELEEMIRSIAKPLSLEHALRGGNGLAIIAEMKKASPSTGVLRSDFVPEQLAEAYAHAGAAALSVVTDEKFFMGSVEHIRQIRPIVRIPILQKDFIVHPYQIQEARAFGADAVLLIVAALDRNILDELLSAARSLRMDALVEVHSEKELELAANAGARLIGINNRNLETLEVDLSVTERLAPMTPPGTTLVVESGIRSTADAQRMQQVGAHALLIGTHFMEATSPGQALKAFVKQAASCFV